MSQTISAKTQAAIAKNTPIIQKNEPVLALPLIEGIKWKNISMPGKVFLVIFLIVLVIELIMEAVLYFRYKGQFSVNVVLGFWVRYVLAAIVAILVGLMILIVINVLYYTGWKILAWIVMLVPFLMMLGTFFSYRMMSQFYTSLTGKVLIDTIKSYINPSN
jgi:hypothetical protein